MQASSISTHHSSFRCLNCIGSKSVIDFSDIIWFVKTLCLGFTVRKELFLTRLKVEGICLHCFCGLELSFIRFLILILLNFADLMSRWAYSELFLFTAIFLHRVGISWLFCLLHLRRFRKFFLFLVWFWNIRIVIVILAEHFLKTTYSRTKFCFIFIS